MILYDIAIIHCPHCGHANYEQTKAGDCNLSTFDIEDAPPEIQAALARERSFLCNDCRKDYTIVIQTIVSVRKS